jgi:hypothetical protein
LRFGVSMKAGGGPKWCGSDGRIAHTPGPVTRAVGGRRWQAGSAPPAGAEGGAGPGQRVPPCAGRCRVARSPCGVARAGHASLAPGQLGEAHGALPWWRTASVRLHAQPRTAEDGPHNAPSVFFSCAQRLVQPHPAANALQRPLRSRSQQEGFRWVRWLLPPRDCWPRSASAVLQP